MKANSHKLLRKGYITGILSGMTWGLDAVMLGIVMSLAPFMDDPILVVSGTFLCSLLHDAFAGAWMCAIMGLKGRLHEFWTAIKSRDGLFCVLGALFGGPLAMTFYILAIAKSGAALTATVTACYPLLGSALAMLILKEKMTLRGWIGLLICVLGIAYLGYSPTGEEQNSTLIGIMLAGVAAIGWATEGVVCGYGMKSGKVDPQMALWIREVTSGVTYLILTPIMLCSISDTLGGLSTIFSYWPAWLTLLVTALIGMSSFLMWYTSIDLIGASKALCLNVTYSFWAVAFSFIIYGGELSGNVVVGSIMVIGGVTLATLLPKKNKLEVSYE